MLHRGKIIRLLQVAIATTDDAVASKNRPKAPALRRLCQLPCLIHPAVRRALKAILVTKHLQQQTDVVNAEALVRRVFVQRSLHTNRHRIAVVVHLKRTNLQLLVHPRTIIVGVAYRAQRRALCVDERLAPYRHAINEHCRVLIIPRIYLDEVQRH